MNLKLLFLTLLFFHQLNAQSYKKIHNTADVVDTHDDILRRSVDSGIGSDFDIINVTPLQLDDVTDYPLITKVLAEKGYSKKDINKILGGNFLRVLKANEKK